MPAKNHLHSYGKVTNKRGQYRDMFRCLDPECSHTIHKVLLVGKKAVCYFCHTEYIVTMPALALKTPHCDDCTRGNRKKGADSEHNAASDNAEVIKMVPSQRKTKIPQHLLDVMEEYKITDPQAAKKLLKEQIKAFTRNK